MATNNVFLRNLHDIRNGHRIKHGRRNCKHGRYEQHGLYAISGCNTFTWGLRHSHVFQHIQQACSRNLAVYNFVIEQIKLAVENSSSLAKALQSRLILYRFPVLIEPAINFCTKRHNVTNLRARGRPTNRPNLEKANCKANLTICLNSYSFPIVTLRRKTRTLSKSVHVARGSSGHLV